MSEQDRFKWEQKYLKEQDSFRAFSQYSIENFELIAQKYEKETYAFVFDLRTQAAKAKLPDVQFLDELLVSIKTVISYYRRLSGAGGKSLALTKQDITNMQGYIKHINNGLNLFLQAKEKNDKFSESIKKVESHNPLLDVKELKRRQEAMTNMTRRADSEQGKSRWLSSASEMMQSKGGIKDTVLASTFGTFAPFASMALTGAGKLAGWVDRTRQTAQLKSRQEALADLGEIPRPVSEAQKTWAGMGSRRASGTGSTLGDRAAAKSRGAGLFGNMFGDRSEVKGTPGGSAASSTFKAELFSFYDVDAKKAWWTKRVVDLLEGMSAIKGEVPKQKEGGLGGLVSEVGKGFVAVLTNPLTWAAAAAVLAPMIGYAIGQIPFVKEFLSGKNGLFTNTMKDPRSAKSGLNLAGGLGVGAAVVDAVKNRFFKSDQQKIQDRITELVTKEHMNPQEAGERAYREFHPMPEYDIIREDGNARGHEPVATVRDMPDPEIERSKMLSSSLKENTEQIKHLVGITQASQAKSASVTSAQTKSRDPYNTGDPLMEHMMSGNYGTED